MAVFLCAGARGDFDGRLPVKAGQPLEPSGRNVSPRVLQFAALNDNAKAMIYWDSLLGTPRYVSPRSKIFILKYDPIVEYQVGSAVKYFLEKNRDFFGVAAADLTQPVVTKVDRSYLVGFRQTLNGTPIRGANIRVMVNEFGDLESVKSFILREPMAPAAEFAQFDLIEAQLADQGITITQAEGQYYFPQYDPSSMTPVWCVLGSDIEDMPWEFFFDPLTGQRWETRRVVFELGEVTGAVMGYYPDPEDIYATAERFTVAGGRFVQYPMMGVRVYEAGSSGGQSTTNRDGQYRVRVAADPGQTAFIECALEYGFAPMR
jgi:hypothetical protein